MKSKTLFSDDESSVEDQDNLKVNEGFAKKYEYNQARKEKELLESKYGQDPHQSSSYSSSSEEDEDAVLLTSKAERKYNELLLRIKNNDKTLFTEVQEGQDYFQDSDFEPSEEKAVKTHKKVTYKDVIRQDVIKKMEGESSGAEDEDHLF